MIERLYRLYAARIHTDDFANLGIAGIKNFRISDDVQVEREIVDGNIFPSITTKLSHAEKFEFSSLNVNSMIDLFGSTGQCLKGTSAQNGFELFLSKIDPCTPGVDSGAVNLRYAIKSPNPTTTQFGMATPVSLVANQGQNAEYSVMVTPRSANGDAAVAVTENIALPAIADTKRRFIMADRFMVNGVSVVGKKSLNINFGVNLLLEKADQALAPEWVSIENVQSVITISGVDPSWALSSKIPRGGKTYAHANTDFFLKDRNELPGALKHIKGTAAGKAFITELASGQANQVTTTTLVMYVEFDGTNAPIVLNTEQAIP